MAIRLSVSIQRYTIYIVLMSLIALPGAWGQERGMYEGSGKVVVTAYAPYWSLSGRDIVPSSLRLRALEDGRVIPDSLYRFEAGRVIWTAPAHTLPLPLEISYRVYPKWLMDMRMRLTPPLADSSGEGSQAGWQYIPYAERRQSFDFRKTAYSGSFSRGITAGNRQDLALNSSFNLQLAGDLGDGLEILAAISDEQLPLQPEGSSLQLREFDRVFVQLSRQGWQLSAGDIDLSTATGTYFLQYYNRLQGAQYRHTKGRGHYRAAAAIARGKFVRYPLPPEEGNQGPYPLRGASGERFIVVLAGTEKVFLNGQVLQRGFDRDYVIDYNRGELTFMPRRPIARESRVVVEYEYAAQDFVRSVTAFDGTWETKNLRGYAQWYSRQDSRSPGPGLSLGREDALALRAAGDDPEKSLISGIRQQEAFSPTRAMYALRDTINACGVRDSVLVYSTDPKEALFTSRFTYVGQGKGHYILADAQGANERAYRWVGADPVACMPRGDYAPIMRIEPPQQQQMLALGQVWSPDAHTSLRTELALSRLDLNRLSALDAGDDLGWAIFADLSKHYILGTRTDAWKLRTRAAVEALHANFRPVNPYRNPEFLRDWSLADFQGNGTTPPANEILSVFETRLEAPALGELSYNFQSFLRSGIYRGGLHHLSWDLRPGNWQFRGGVRVNLAEQEHLSVRFWRPVLEFGRRFPKIGNWRLTGILEGESNRRQGQGNDSLDFSSFAFYRYQLSLESPLENSWQWQGRYMQRKDLLPILGQWAGGPAAQELSFSGKWQKSNTRLSGTLNYRKLESALPIAQPTGEVFLGRVEGALQLLKGAIRGNTMVETGTGQEPKREFTFIKVAPGEGAYIWLDSLYNNDGVIQFYEMETAPFADQADYIRVSSVSNIFVRSNYASINQSLQLEPGVLVRGKESIAARQLGKFSGQLSWRLHYRTQEGGQRSFRSPFTWNITDSALLALNAGIRQTVVFNRADPKWEAQWARNRTDGKMLQTTGFETRQLDEQSIQIRWNWSSQWVFRPVFSFGRRGSRSESFAVRDYNILFYRSEAQVSWLPDTRLRFQGNLRFQSDKNTLPLAPDRAFTRDFALETTFNPATNTSLRIKGSLVRIRYEGTSRSPVGFAILNGLQAGDNILWEFSFDRQLARGLQLRFSYDGRKTGGNPVAHIGRAQVTAVF
jgi:hypothetical protein